MADSEINVDIRELISEPGMIPSLSLVYHEINRAVNDPLTSVQTLTELIGEDPGIATRILYLANSGFYGFPSKINTISEAVTLIGLQQVRDLTLATVVLDAFSGIDSKLVTMDDFWKHSLACGIAARVIGSKLQDKNLEKYFVAGLLHDIGRLIIYFKFTDKAQEILIQALETQQLVGSLERSILGFDHAEMGEAMLAQWMLPQELREAVRWHHLPSEATDSFRVAAAIQVADVLVNALEIGTSGEQGVPPLPSETWMPLGLHPEDVPMLIDEIERQFLDVEHIFLKLPGM